MDNYRFAVGLSHLGDINSLKADTVSCSVHGEIPQHLAQCQGLILWNSLKRLNEVSTGD